MPTKTETQPDAKYLLREPVRGILLEDDLSAIPREVETANALAVAAWESLQQAMVQLRHARAEQKLAPSLDASADAAAIAAGKELPTERAQHAAREAVQLAARREQAARSHARSTQLELAYCIHKHRVVWISDQTGVVTAAEGECIDLLRQLGVALDALTRERTLLAGLEGFPLGGHLDYARMGRFDAPVTSPEPELAGLKERITPTSSTPTRNSAPMSKRVLGQ
jgi:hypothetical protein